MEKIIIFLAIIAAILIFGRRKKSREVVVSVYQQEKDVLLSKITLLYVFDKHSIVERLKKRGYILIQEFEVEKPVLVFAKKNWFFDEHWYYLSPTPDPYSIELLVKSSIYPYILRGGENSVFEFTRALNTNK